MKAGAEHGHPETDPQESVRKEMPHPQGIEQEECRRQDDRGQKIADNNPFRIKEGDHQDRAEIVGNSEGG